MKNPEINEIWKYTRTGQHYVIEGFAPIKIGYADAWADGVLYRCGKECKLYCRDIRTFLEKFEPVVWTKEDMEEIEKFKNRFKDLIEG